MIVDSKLVVSYVHFPDCEYTCGECSAYIPETYNCALHGSDVFLPNDSCNYMTKGTPCTFGKVPMGLLTKRESGFVRSPYGFSCKRCIAFIPSWDCQEVDKSSIGDDQGMIHPNACCNHWTENPEKQLPKDVLIPLMAAETLKFSGPGLPGVVLPTQGME